jgi:hypothetical protein
MTVTAVTPPTPPNSNLDRSMFVWIPTAGAASDPISTDAKMQSLLNFCASNGVNLLYLDIWQYLGGGNWSTAHYQQVQKFIHYAHASGIAVWALAGNNDWQHNQQWVMNNITRHLVQYQALSEASSTTNIAGQFDGVMLDVEYWTVSGYTAADVVGLIDLVKAMKTVLNLPVGCFMSQWQADSTSAALTVTYNGDTGLEGLVVMHHVDAVVVGCYSNNGGGVTGATQVAMFANWFNDACTTGAGKNNGLWCGSETDAGQPAGTSYSGETKATMEANHTAISNSFTGTPNTNAVFRGQAISTYASYSGMS